MENENFNELLRQQTYNDAFRRGHDYVLYEREDELEDDPAVDYSDFESIGYYDGYNYGEFCYRAGLKNDIRDDLLVANMDKCYSQAIKRNTEYLEKEAGKSR